MASSQTVDKFKGQNYEELKRQSLQKGTPFTDDEFEANDASIGDPEKAKGVRWMRPKEICESGYCPSKSPKFISRGTKKRDVNQKQLGDCWFLAAAASLTLHPKLLKKVILENQTFDNNPGIFRFRFWQRGQWVEVVVDDRLATKNGNLIFATSYKNDDFWMPLLEKAYAKLKGSYKKIEGGVVRKAFIDLTGGIGETIALKKCLKKPKVCKIIETALDSNFLTAGSISDTKDPKQIQRLNGLVVDHVYSIISTHTLTVAGKTINLIKLRNPWGHEEWKGDWSDNSQLWDKVDAALKEKLLVKKNNGEFWMNMEEFREIFDRVHICYVNDEGTSFQNSFRGHWPKDRNASKDFQFQFHVSLQEPDKVDSTFLLVSLMQLSGKESLKIGFKVYMIPQEVTKEYLEKPDRRKALFSQFKPETLYTATDGEHTKRFELSREGCLIIPVIEPLEEEADFLIRIVTGKKHKFSAL